MIAPNFFNLLFVIPFLNILVFFYKGFVFLGVPGALGWAIIGLTLIIRFILNPFFKKQTETNKKLQQLKPELDLLAKKYKNNPQQLQKEQLKLYQKAGINPATGCLLPLIQMPIFVGLYNTLSLFLLNDSGKKVVDAINQVVYFPFLRLESIDPWFLGFNLALSPAASKNFFYLIIPVLTAFLQYYQFKITESILKTSSDNTNSPEKEKKDTHAPKDDLQKAMSFQMKFFFPIMIGWLAYSLPVGLSLYWNVFGIIGLIRTKK